MKISKKKNNFWPVDPWKVEINFQTIPSKNPKSTPNREIEQFALWAVNCDFIPKKGCKTVSAVNHPINYKIYILLPQQKGGFNVL